MGWVLRLGCGTFIKKVALHFGSYANAIPPQGQGLGWPDAYPRPDRENWETFADAIAQILDVGHNRARLRLAGGSRHSVNRPIRSCMLELVGTRQFTFLGGSWSEPRRLPMTGIL